MGQSTDIVERLRGAAEDGRSPILGHLHVEDRLMIEAAAEIERLRALLKGDIAALKARDVPELF